MMHRFIVLGLALASYVAGSDLRVEVYEYFDNVHASTQEEAKEACEMRGGKLAVSPDFDDWDNYVVADTIEDNVLMDTYFSVNIRKTNGAWQYADGTRVDMTSTRALTLRELDSGVHGSHSYDCALWNPWEPFFVPCKCKDYNAFICSVPVTLYTSCGMDMTEDTRFVYWPGTLEYEPNVSQQQCTSQCTSSNATQSGLECWAAEYDVATERCTLLFADEKPRLVPETQVQSGRKTFLKNCKMVAAFEENTCSVLCKCNTQDVIVIPTDEEEYQKFVEEAVNKNKRELTVPTSNLSSTIRKKSSASDERDSSAGMGALGIALLSLVFGGLLFLDLLSLCQEAKAAIGNGGFGQLTSL